MSISTDGVAQGIHHVRTISGATYVLDLDRQAASRSRDGGGPEVAEEMDLLEIVECEIGKPLHLVVRPHWPGIVRLTWRSTPVTDIYEVRT
ncbi:hypothetical protein [Paramicrobacterium humi]|uniref:hypothetical protein n=1 Tax=Paramicrobacterium humi TaxID=640635 RepID=UPI00115F8437|nr:hypothetical protein [Microbacterium humi]